MFHDDVQLARLRTCELERRYRQRRARPDLGTEATGWRPWLAGIRPLLRRARTARAARARRVLRAP